MYHSYAAQFLQICKLQWSETVFFRFQVCIQWPCELCRVFPQTAMKHIMAILISVFSLGYHGKTIDFEKYSSCHRTTVAHFLNKGKWDDTRLDDILKSTVIQFIYKEALQSGKPVFCIVDDTISSKTKSSSRALHPIEDAYFHQSHLKGKQDYGHQAVAVMLSCNGIVLNYAVVLYDKTMSKVKIVQEIADELPVPPVISYFLCDWGSPSISCIGALCSFLNLLIYRLLKCILVPKDYINSLKHKTNYTLNKHKKYIISHLQQQNMNSIIHHLSTFFLIRSVSFW